ncbi:MAG: hypothetical protein WCD18_12510, partial [Thermosynechococcaceae cyanobacterium]
GGGAGGMGGPGGTGSAGQPGKVGQGGFGGGNGEMGLGGGGGGFGGGIFIRSGQLTLRNVTFDHNAAIAGTGAHPGQGKGGAIFMVTPAHQTAAGVRKAPQVVAWGTLPIFRDNTASHNAHLPTDNENVYGAIQVKGLE